MSTSKHLLLLAATTLFISALAGPSGCSDAPLTGGSTAAGTGGGTTGTAGTGGDSAASSSSSSASSGSGSGGAPAFLCPTVFHAKPSSAVKSARVAGEWNSFNLPTATTLSGPDASGVYTGTVKVAPGLQAYKIIYDKDGAITWELDPAQGRRKYVSGTENSAIKVPDCRLPSFTVTKSQAQRPAAGPGQGTYQAEIASHDGIESSGIDPASITATLSFEGIDALLTPAQLVVDPTSGASTLSLAGLTDGKYRITIQGKSKNGKASEPLRLVFWIEAEAFSWKDAVIYMAMTDRYRDGDATNNASPTPGADPRGDFQGGDLDGIRQGIADGSLDKLGVRAIWLTPFQTNPKGAFIASDGVHKVTGYHGYWPTKAREVDPRIGGEKALRALVKEAHQHGIRILQDFVVNHVHQEHEYVAAHPDWFRTGCVCGTNNCDWTSHALDCMFAYYLPDVNHTVPEATAAFTSDAVWWLDTFDLDGLRVDAVKHVEEVATRNLAAEVREAFEPAGTRYFLMGETAMGWSDCADPCNDENYGTISKYIGPLGLDGQFDFVLYHGVSYRTFAYGDKGMLHADYWLSHGLSKYPSEAIMTPYIGSHDTQRFVSLADYRGQDAAHDRGIPGNQWDNIAVAPGDAEPYKRARIGLAWLLNLPGAPLLYYGDEYGQWGGSDPNNRLMWRGEPQLTADESATLAFTRKLGTARRTIPALRRGSYVALSVSEDNLVFGRLVAPGNAAIVGLTRAPGAQTVTFDTSGPLGLGAQTVLHDALGGPNVTVDAAGKATITLPPGGAVVLAP
jgi:glycosidase